jgi:hypothetical protein
MDANLAFIHRPGKTMSHPDSNRAIHIYRLQEVEEPGGVGDPHRTVSLPCKSGRYSTECPLDICADQVEWLALQLESLHDGDQHYQGLVASAMFPRVKELLRMESS